MSKPPKGAATARKTITLSVVSIERLDELAAKGWYGPDGAGVAAHFVEAGLREAREKGYFNDEGKKP